MIAENLLAQIAEHGFRLRIDNGACSLVKALPDAVMPDSVMGRVKAGKGHLLALCVCGECGRVTTDPLDFERFRQPNPFCDLKACPYRAKRKWGG